jgi:GT2 family glycosyltransferase
MQALKREAVAYYQSQLMGLSSLNKAGQSDILAEERYLQITQFPQLTSRTGLHSASSSPVAAAHTPSLSIVVLTYNRHKELLDTLGRLKALEAQYPICVVDNGSTDDTAALVREKFPDVNVIQLRENLGAAGRNYGVAAIDTQYVAFCDDDTWWAYGALAKGIRILDAFPELAVLTARILVGPEQREDPTSALMAASPLGNTSGCPGTETIGFMAGACVMRRDAFMRGGGYEQKFFLGGEETLLAYDIQELGWRLAYIPSMELHHHPSLLRDSALRRKLLLRNALWCVWMRRPWHRVMQETYRHAMRALREPALGKGLLEAFRDITWAWRRRRVLPDGVETRLRCVERSMN